MANTIALAAKYLPRLDAVYKKAALTSLLDTPDVQFVNANTIKVYKMTMDGLGNYSRSTGFVSGDVVGAWETMTLAKDRGRSFSIDAMDQEESINQAFGRLAGEFIRTKVAPEIDSYRFAVIAGWSGISTTTAVDFSATGSHDVLGALDEAERQMNDDEVPDTGRILYMANSVYKLFKADITRTFAGQTTIQNGIEYFNKMPIITVPSSRFSTAITLYDGSTDGQEDGGYIQTAATGYPINFMIVHPSAVVSVAKHVKPRIFAPDTNQSADAWKFDYRIYHDLFVYDNKVDGIYLHRAATANT